MKDTINEIYNGFLLRDLLGYVLPGSFVFACLLHCYTVIAGVPFIEFVKTIPDNSYINIFAICISYACGHFLSGLFFHTKILSKIFKYSPQNVLNDYPDLTYDEAWVTHRSNYKKIADTLNDSIKTHIERHAALLHFTGHFSAGLIFAILYIVILAFYFSNLNLLKFAIPLVIILPGIYNHYKRLAVERYLLEMKAINSK